MLSLAATSSTGKSTQNLPPKEQRKALKKPNFESQIALLSIIPVLNAPGTIPIDKLRSNRLKKYLGKLNEVVKKEEIHN